tara:strand:+ start:1171 stop:1908 length:738 start_codon:yes stop_codon:yes gene_type:complete
MVPVQGHAACWSQKSQPATLMSLGADGTMTLADGRALLLAGIETPPDEKARAGWQSIFDAIMSPVSLHPVLQPQDRYGRLQMLVVTGDGVLLQEKLVAGGLARVMPQKRARDCLETLLASEAEARQARRGLWRDPAFALRDADDVAGLMRDEGHYTLVEGTVVDATNRQGRFYINFGADWRTDFTVTVEPADARLFAGEITNIVAGQVPAIVGRRLRVRGFLTRYNGPEIRVTVPEQIEVLAAVN